MFAQNDSLQSHLLKNVVITATKFPKNQWEMGKVLTIIDKDQISQSAGKDISQLLNEQAGITVNGANSNSGKDKAVYIRGAANKYTLILIDGIPVNDPSGIDGGAYDLRLLPLDQVERIEILKGSQSTLYGSDAIAGVINIITKKGSDKPISGNGLVSYGSYNTFKALGGLAGTSKSLDYTIGYVHYSTSGISEAEGPSHSANFEKDGMNQNSVQANLGFRPMEHLNIKPFFRYTDFSGKFDAGPFQDDPVDQAKSFLLNTGLNAQYTLKRGALNLLYGFDETNRNYTYSFGQYQYRGQFQNTEMFWNQELSSKVQFLAGLNFQQWKMTDSLAVDRNPSTTIASPYLSLFLRPAPGFIIEMGARLNQHSKYGTNTTFSLNPSYTIQNKFKLFVNYSSGFKAPSLTQLFGQYGANPALKPELSLSLEGGIHYIAPNKKVDVRVVVFRRNVRQAIIYAFNTNAFQYLNVDEQQDDGLEIEPTFHISNRLTVKAYYAFVEGRVKTKSSKGEDTTYNNLIRRPKNSFGVNIGVQANKLLFMSINLKSVGMRSDQYYDANFILQKTTLAAYQLLDLYLEYKLLGTIKLFVEGRNLLNQQYQEVYGYSTQGVTITTGISAKF